MHCVKRSTMLLAEALGTLLLVATVVGSGIMASRLAVGNHAVALLANTVATGAALYVLITIFGPISGAHFNPMVSLWISPATEKLPRMAAQVIGGAAGAVLANLMFDQAAISVATTARASTGIWISEIVASAGLMMTILLGVRFRPAAVPALVAAWVVAGYWFTASTCFANPAVTIARMLSDSFAGIRPMDAGPFIVAQFIGGGIGATIARGITATSTEGQPT